ncbi:MAG: NAD(P)-dependent oxidoreductase, partial [Bacilli bacterium]
MNNPITVGITGTTGSMGSQILLHILNNLKEVKVRLLFHSEKNLSSSLKRAISKNKERVTKIFGDFTNISVCQELVKGCDYLIHCGAIIPPKSDHNPQRAFQVNFGGTKNIVDSIKKINPEIRFVYISTVAVYGDRNYKHLWARMGDPVFSTPYDYYSASKIKAERYVLESDLPYFVVLRQTGVLHPKFFSGNLNDGLMFHTMFNGPLEWCTDNDSGLLIQHLIEKDSQNLLKGFWKKDYNISGGDQCRETGYETFSHGFALMGAKPEQFFNPNW